jgi:hypothetical protein
VRPDGYIGVITRDHATVAAYPVAGQSWVAVG